MELTHDFTVPASIDQAWETFMDLERVGGCFPGATVTEADGDSFAGTVKVKLGPIALVYAGAGRFVERDDSVHKAVIEAKGKDKRGNGTAGATVTVHLSPGSNETRVDVTTDLSVTGKPAQFGRGVMQDVSDKLLQQFVQCIEGQLAQAAEDASAVGAAEPVAAEPGAPSAGGDAVPAPDAGAAATPAAAEPPALTSVPGGASDGPAPAAPRPAPRPASAPARPSSDDSIDLGATVLPVVIRSYAPHLLAGLLGTIIGILIGRRSRR